jgi:hypothetical protein
MRDPEPGEDPVRWLLRVSHRLPPAQVPVAVDRALRLVGAASATLLLVDFGQRLLVPFLPPGAAPRRPVSVDGTAAGDTFRYQAIRRSGGEGRDGGEPGPPTVWVPLVDGADRLGVVEVEEPGDATLGDDDLHDLATVAASLLVSKEMYSDLVGVTRGRDSLDVAAELRWSFLPPLTFIGPEVTVAAMLEPAYEIAGDCFDYSVDAEEVHLAIFDAMGHGLEASRLANLAVAAYRQCRRQRRSFAETQRLVDATMQEEFGDFRFVTAVLARLDLRTGRVAVFSAGHPPPLLVRGNQATPVESRPSRPFGLGGPPGEPVEAQLEPGDILVLLSDGITEARAPDGEHFGDERLAVELTSGEPGESVSETVRRALQRVVEYQAHELRDDATLLLARWEPG